MPPTSTMPNIPLPDSVIAILTAGPDGERTPAPMAAPEPEQPVPTAMPAQTEATSEETVTMAKTVSVPTGPDGLPMDPMALLHEPLFVRAYRQRGIGPQESVPLANGGTNWSLSMVRQLEKVIEGVAGGGDFKVIVADDRGQKHEWAFNIQGPEKRMNSEPTVTTPPTSFGTTTTPTMGSAAPGVMPLPGGLGVATLPNGMTMIVPMPDDQSGPSSPYPRAVAQQAWGPYADLGARFSQAERENERLRSQIEMEKARAAHDNEIAELRRAIESRHDTGPSADVLALREQVAALTSQISQERERNALEQRMAEMQRSHEKTLDTLKEEMRRANDRPKEDPMKPMLELMKAQAEAAKEAGRVQADAQKEAARDTRDTFNLLLTKMESGQAAMLPTMINAFGSLAQFQQSTTTTMMDLLKEVAEIRKGEDTPWWGKFLEPIVTALPDLGGTMAQGYALSQQAKANAAARGAGKSPQFPPGRKPRAPEENKPEPVETTAKPSNGANANSADPVIAALAGYESSIPGEVDNYDAEAWKAALAEIRVLRDLVHQGKVTPRNAAGWLLKFAGAKHDLGIAEQIPAFAHFQNDPVELATFVGMALGAGRDDTDKAQFMEFKKAVLQTFGEALNQLAAKLQKAQEQQAAANEGDESNEDENGDGDDSADEIPAPGA